MYSNRQYTLVPLMMRADEIVFITGSNGGILTGECFACKKKGLLSNRLGNAWAGPVGRDNKILYHTHMCPINRVLVNRPDK